MKCILGLDISTSITGATLIDLTGKIIYCESWDTRNKKKYPTLFSKASQIKNNLNKLKEQYDIEDIYIEESLFAFKSGFSSAKTISTLSKINGIVSYLAYELFGLEPKYLGATSARKICGIKVPRGHKAKEVVLRFLLDNEESFLIFYTKNGNPVAGTFDRADSLIIARAGLETWKKIKEEPES
jgi:Holliday junction resolvasome RuvABC endonuclease subunit